MNSYICLNSFLLLVLFNSDIYYRQKKPMYNHWIKSGGKRPEIQKLSRKDDNNSMIAVQ